MPRGSELRDRDAKKSSVERSTAMAFDQNLLVVSQIVSGFSISAAYYKVPTIGITQRSPSVSHTAYENHQQN